MPRGRQHGFKRESMRLGLLKVKPSLRNSIFKGLHFWQWSCLFGHVCEIGHVPIFCLFWEVSVNIRLPIKRSLRPMTFVDCFETYSKKSCSMFCLFSEVSVNIKITNKEVSETHDSC